MLLCTTCDEHAAIKQCKVFATGERKEFKQFPQKLAVRGVSFAELIHGFEEVKRVTVHREPFAVNEDKPPR